MILHISPIVSGVGPPFWRWRIEIGGSVVASQEWFTSPKAAQAAGWKAAQDIAEALR